MSFNHHHINIDRNNYEEYFLLYIDGELSCEQADAVENFAKLHSDLQEELTILLNTKLYAEPVVLESKQQLFSHNMKMDSIENSLLLYIDNELPAVERKTIEQQLNADSALKLQYEVLQKTKLDAADELIYPYKAELYHAIPKAIRPVFWLRIAAAIILILSIGILWWTNTYNKVEPVIALKENPAVIEPPANVEDIPTDVENYKTSSPVVGSLAIVDNAKKKRSEKNEVIEKIPVNNVAKKKTIKASKPSLILLEHNKEIIAINKIEEPGIDKKISSIEAITRPQQNLNGQPVTTEAIAAYTTIEAPANKSMANFAAATTGNEKDKKGSVRGFLRKASRFIERRTGINPVNEDDELLIGAIAIKL
jgi:hypothetical protein